MRQCCLTCENCDIDPISPIKIGLCQINECETKSSSGSRCRDYCPKDSGDIIVVGVRLSVPIYKIIDEMSNQMNKTVSSIVEDAVHLYIAKEGMKNDK